MDKRIGWSIVLITLAITLVVIFTNSQFYAKIGEYVMILFAGALVSCVFSVYRKYSNKKSDDESSDDLENAKTDKKKKFLLAFLMVVGLFALFAFVAGMMSNNVELNTMIGKGLIILFTLVVAIFSWIKLSK